jgi:hypothetical protein
MWIRQASHAESGLQEDVIEKIGRQGGEGRRGSRNLARSKDGKPSLLLVHRKDATIFLTLASR